jgi:hypothetical protein
LLQAEQEEGADYLYKTCKMDNGLEFVGRLDKKGGAAAVIGVDAHMTGTCIWEGYPVMSLGNTAELPAFLCSSADGHGAFIVNMIHLGLYPGKITEKTLLKMQVCGFPRQMDIYKDRKDFEQRTRPPYPVDKTVYPYAYLRSLDTSAPSAVRKKYDEVKLFNSCCGVIGKVRDFTIGSSATVCHAAMMDTMFGSIELIYSDANITSGPQPGNYVSASVFVSADVLF